MDALEFWIGELEDAANVLRTKAGYLSMAPALAEAMNALLKATEQVIVAYDEATGNLPGQVMGEDNQ